MTTHLSFTGYHAGARLCGIPRDAETESVHAVYAPLHLDAYREKCCGRCLDEYAMSAYEQGDEMPDWVTSRRKELDNALTPR